MLPVNLMAGNTAISNSDAQLIWELVADISDSVDVLARFGLTAVDLRAKMRDKMFVSAYKEAKKLWSSDLNIKQRTQLKAAMMLEDSLQDLFKIIKDDAMPVSAKLESIEKLGKISGMTQVSKDGSVGTSHKVIINIGAHSAPLVIQGTSHQELEHVE